MFSCLTAAVVWASRMKRCLADALVIRLGQTAHFVHRYDGFSGKVITGLEVAVNDTAVEKPKIISKPDPKMVDVGQIVFEFRPEKAGVYRIKVQTLTGTEKGASREYVLEVADQE